MLLDETRIKAPSRPQLALRLQVAVITAVLGSTAYAVKAVAQEHRDRVISLAEARELVHSVRGAEGLSLQIDESVVDELNRRLQSPARRRETREALERMKSQFAAVVDPMLARYQLPRILRSVPMIESRNQNLPDPNREGYGAGLWMFLARTARIYGLTVNESVDERLNVVKESDAAGRYLKHYANQYQDLGLSLLAYNWGERRVNQLMSQTGSRDAWVLSRARGGGERYLSSLVAAILIDANPKLAD